MKVSKYRDTVDLIAAETVDFIRSHEPPEGYFIAFSGGKDSITALELVKMAGVRYEAYFSSSGIHPPEVVKFIRQYYPEVRFLYPREGFFDLVKRKFPPLRTKRWCCDYLQKQPSKGVPLKHRIVGVRAEESDKRADRPRIDINRREKTTLYKPVFLWKEWTIWEFIEKYHLPYPSLYDEGWSRVGCVICPFICTPNRKMVDRNRERWPGLYKAFEHAVRVWFERKKAQGASIRETTAEEYIEHWYCGIG